MCRPWRSTSLEQHRAGIDLQPEQGVRLFAQVFSFTELGLMVQLIGGEVEIAIGRHR
jgi:hypothetical protein